MTPDDQDVLARVDRLVAEVLEPAAAEVDRARRIPPHHLDALAEAGLRGLNAPVAAGGLGATPALVDDVIERLAAGCLATTFVWVQHLGVVGRVAGAEGDRFGTLLHDLVAGRCRAGVAIGGVRPGVAEPLVAETVDAATRLRGAVPWLTGWGMIDEVLVAARAGAELLWFLVPVEGTTPPPGMSVRRFELAVTNAACSVSARFDGTLLEADRLVARDDHGVWSAADGRGLGMNAALGLGIAGRAGRALAEAGEGSAARVVIERVDRLRARLRFDDPRHRPLAGGRSLPALRAEVAELALLAAGAAATAAGGRGLERGSREERLVREAQFCLVFGSRPAIRSAQLERLSADPD